jgi:hypothetical protein
MLTETTYADYRDFGGVQFPTKITQKAGGFPTLDLAVSEVKPYAAVDIQVPDNVRQAAVKVQTDKIADGVWYLTGCTHHSALVEMADHLVVIDGPQDNARSTALIAEVKKMVLNKPINSWSTRITTLTTPAAWAPSSPTVPPSSRRKQGIFGAEPCSATHCAAR